MKNEEKEMENNANNNEKAIAQAPVIVSGEKKVEVRELIEKGKAKGSISQSDIMEAFEDADYDIEQVEKLYEVLVTSEEMLRAEDLGDFYRISADNRNLNYDNYFSKGNASVETIEPYHSHNTQRVDVEGMKQLLLKLKLFGGQY